MKKRQWHVREFCITSFYLDSSLRRSHLIASEYHITLPRLCLPYATFNSESDLDLQDRTKNVILIFKIVPITGHNPLIANEVRAMIL